MRPRQLNLTVVSRQEIDGLEMGVMSDGTAFLSGNGLAGVTGLAVSSILEWAPKWNPGARTGRDRKIKDLLERAGYFEDELFIQIKHGGQTINAFPDVVCAAVLEYYAFDATPPRPEALHNFRIFASAGLRLYIYSKTGYDPKKQVPDAWRAYHARNLMNAAPPGFFSVFQECDALILHAIRGGLVVDDHTVPDGSVGGFWAQHWDSISGDTRWEPRKRHPHIYPDDFPQSKAAGGVHPWCYPVDALGEFRRWLNDVYLPEKYPRYLETKERQGALPPSGALLILKAMGIDPELGAGE